MTDEEFQTSLRDEGFQKWKEECRKLFMEEWYDKLKNRVVYDPWIKTEYEEYKKGTTPADFVKSYIKPYIEYEEKL